MYTHSPSYKEKENPYIYKNLIKLSFQNSPVQSISFAYMYFDLSLATPPP